jgi:hypothetical protein
VSASALKSEIESTLTGRFNSLKLAAAPLSEFVPSGIPEIDSIAGGLPRGAIAELIGPVSSGRTSLLLSVLAEATERQELCALVDLNDAFDAEAAPGMRIDFDYLLWIRCCGNVEHAFKATELLLQSAGFGLVVMDLGDLAIKHAHRVPSSSWFRLRRTVEDTPTSLLVIEQQPSARTCASLILETNREGVKWTDEQNLPLEGAALFGGLRLRIERHKPISSKERETKFETAL